MGAMAATVRPRLGAAMPLVWAASPRISEAVVARGPAVAERAAGPSKLQPGERCGSMDRWLPMAKTGPTPIPVEVPAVAFGYWHRRFPAVERWWRTAAMVNPQTAAE